MSLQERFKVLSRTVPELARSPGALYVRGVALKCGSELRIQCSCNTALAPRPSGSRRSTRTASPSKSSREPCRCLASSVHPRWASSPHPHNEACPAGLFKKRLCREVTTPRQTIEVVLRRWLPIMRCSYLSRSCYCCCCCCC